LLDKTIIMAKTIAIVAEKGGVGKTTSVLTLGRALVELERRVLLVDLDPQASLTKYLGHDPKALDVLQKTVIYSLTNGISIETLIIPGAFDIVPSSRATWAKVPSTFSALKEALKPLRDRYDYVLIDSPPVAQHLITISLAAADEVLVPVEPDRMALDGLSELIDTIALVRDRYNPDLGILGVLPTKVNRRHKNDALYLGFIQALDKNGITVFEPVPHTTRFKRAASRGQTVVDLFPQRAGAREYYNLAKIIIEHE